MRTLGVIAGCIIAAIIIRVFLIQNEILPSSYPLDESELQTDISTHEVQIENGAKAGCGTILDMNEIDLSKQKRISDDRKAALTSADENGDGKVTELYVVTDSAAGSAFTDESRIFYYSGAETSGTLIRNDTDEGIALIRVICDNKPAETAHINYSKSSIPDMETGDLLYSMTPDKMLISQSVVSKDYSAESGFDHCIVVNTAKIPAESGSGVYDVKGRYVGMVVRNEENGTTLIRRQMDIIDFYGNTDTD